MTLDGTSGSVVGQIEVTEDLAAGSYGIFVVLYEVEAPRVPNLARDFPVNNETLTALSVGQTQEVSADFTVDPSWNPEHLHAVLFVQHLEGNKEILQAAGNRAGGPPTFEPMILTGPGEGRDNPSDLHGYLPAQTDTPFLAIDAYAVDRYG